MWSTYRIAVKFRGSKNSQIAILERFIEIILQIRCKYRHTHELMNNGQSVPEWLNAHRFTGSLVANCG